MTPDPIPTDTNQGGNNGSGAPSGGDGPAGIDLSRPLDLLGGNDDTDGGSSGGGGTSAPVDPNIIGGARDYYAIWGIQPPQGYIEGLVKSGLNRYEIVEHELAKPRAESTAFYRDRYAAFAAKAADIFGRR